MGKDRIEEIGIANVIRAYNWNTKLLKCVGVWPLKIYDPIFLFFFIYLSIHCSLTLAHLIYSPKTIDNVVSNISENIILSMTLMKITTIRINRESLGKLLMDVKEDSLSENYESKEEKEIFYKYTKLPPRFILTAVISMTLAILLYYVNGLKIGLQIAKQNNSMGNQLPYKVLVIIDLNDNRIYALVCAYQTMIIPSIIFGYVGFDCMFVNLSTQIVAQFAILSHKMNDILNNSENYHEGIKKLVLRHYRLIRLAERLEDNFNIVIMQQLLGTTIHLCISGYHLLMSKETKDNIALFLFISYGFCVINTLFIYCYIGECLIQESTNFGNAIYNYDWYNLSATDSKFILICMIRTKKPQFLTSGKFVVLSLTIFTDIVKTSMGYLSVLRTFL
ncbi:odorant receptor 4-like isoform X1 [Vespa velutina]|uniref:odorant receptor 4-like isoform X1 n=1 Tax=Vespa velutina TaxID=202808 RepID=UPI001FB23B2C|nr:odorant receptor 4-like isoform X1 [Vespa velutina]